VIESEDVDQSGCSSAETAVGLQTSVRIMGTVFPSSFQ
jgi:hypothetical protein